METDTNQPRARKTRIATHVTSIDALVGAHPDALEEIYRKGDPATVEAMGERPRGVLLNVVQTASFHLLARPLVRIVATTLMPWEGVVFDHGGNAGANIVRGRETMRFRAERVPSLIDGEPTLALTYPTHAWLRDEIRMLNEGLALGITFIRVFGKDVPVAWFGLSA